MAEASTDPLAHAVRRQLGLGRLLSLGEADDGVWIAEHAAAAVLRAAVAAPEARLRSLRLTLADPEAARESAVPAPPSALPPGPARITADFAATADQPLPQTADRLREALGRAAEERLGLPVAAVDLHAVALLDAPTAEEPGTDTAPDTDLATGRDTDQPPGAAVDQSGGVADAVTAVPGVTRLAPALGGLASAVRTTGTPTGSALQIQLAVAADHRALDVARAARDAAVAASPGPTVAAILITAVDG